MNLDSSTSSLIIASVLLAMVPTVLCVATCYLKVSIVFGMIKSALGTNSVPGIMITSAISLLVTIYVMEPVVKESYEIYQSSSVKTWNIFKDQKAKEEIIKIAEPFKIFFEKHSGRLEKKFFSELRTDKPNKEESSMLVVIPAFTLTELREAFQMSCYLLLPFLVVDLLVASILGGMGLYMVSPVSIALPLKLLLFVSSDCWLVITKGLILSYKI
jgi:type III secretion protein R